MSLLDRMLSFGRAALGRDEPPIAKTGVAVQPQDAQFAPWPLIDKYPIVLGSSLTLQSISNVMRLAHTGYRMQYVDLLDELLEREPHGFAVISQRILTVAGGRIDVTPPKLSTAGERDEELAQKIANDVAHAIHAVADLKQSLASLLWGLYTGVAASEISWTNEGGMWRPERLHFIHSRRLAYPDSSTWDLHVWDQGNVRGWNDGYDSPTQRLFGLRVRDYPGKFVVHTPQLRGDYPTREGLGRELAYWFAIKAMAARSASHYLERFGKPWPIATYTTQPDKQPRAAETDDINKAQATMLALGAGSLSGATLPDCISVGLFGPGQKGAKIAMTHEAFITVINAEISKCVQGQTFTTETGKFGSRSTADVGESSALRIGAYDAACLADTMRRDIAYWIVKLNYPEAMHLVPDITIHIEAEPDVGELIRRCKMAVSAGLPVNAEEFGRLTGLPLVPREPGDTKPRRMVPLKPVDIGVIDPDAVRGEPVDKKEAAPANDTAADTDEPTEQAAE